jgi:hypothetical protein
VKSPTTSGHLRAQGSIHPFDAFARSSPETSAPTTTPRRIGAAMLAIENAMPQRFFWS